MIYLVLGIEWLCISSICALWFASCIGDHHDNG